MNKSNTLIIKEGHLQLNGFKDLKSKVTFCFLPAGVIIMTGHAEKRPFRFQTEVDEHGYIHNMNILLHLTQRDIIAPDYFFYHENCFYEMDPHRAM